MLLNEFLKERKKFEAQQVRDFLRS